MKLKSFMKIRGWCGYIICNISIKICSCSSLVNAAMQNGFSKLVVNENVPLLEESDKWRVR